MGARIFLTVWILVFSLLTYGTDWDPQSRLPVRSRIADCVTLLSPAEPTVNDSVGIEVSTNRVDDFKAKMELLLRERSHEQLTGSHLFVTGIAIEDEKATQLRYEIALRELGFAKGAIRVRVLSLPIDKVRSDATDAFYGLLQRLLYWFPSIKRDYQTPMLGEVISGMVSNAAVEASNIAYLYMTLPRTDANLTVTTHATTLTLYIVYKKFMVNWLMRPGSSKLAGFLKQASLSLPFVLNYSVFGNFSKIVAFYRDYGWEATAHRFPTELANVAATQGFSIFLQTVFYNLVITNGIGGWENSKKGDRESRAARVLSSIIATPLLAVDSIVLAYGAANPDSLFYLGPLSITGGHLALASLTAAGSVFWMWPQILDPTIRVYEAVADGFAWIRERLNSWIRNGRNENPATVASASADEP